MNQQSARREPSGARPRTRAARGIPWAASERATLAPRTRRSTVKKPERAARVVRPETRPAIGETPGGSTAPTAGSVEASMSARRGAEARPAVLAEAVGAEGAAVGAPGAKGDGADMRRLIRAECTNSESGEREAETRGMHGALGTGEREAETRGMHVALETAGKKG